MTGWRLVADAGGTNVRFARAKEGKGLVEPRTYPVSRFPAFMSALAAYLEETGGWDGCIGAAIGAAGPVESGTATLTNLGWAISEAEVAASIGAACALINDVQAVAFSLPSLSKADITILGPLAPDLTSARRLLAANIGTGFGAATLVKTACGWTSCPSEAGHMSLSLPHGVESSLRHKFPSVEHLLSGRGLCNLRAAFANDAEPHDAAQIVARADGDPHCAAALRLFTEVAGKVLGDLVLAAGAWDGVFLYGSVAKGIAGTADHSLLRQAFEEKGPMNAWMKRIPTALIVKEDAALAGLSAVPLGAILAQRP